MYNTTKEPEEDVINSQCPECKNVRITYANSKGVVTTEPSVVMFGASVRKEMCRRCVDKYKIDL